MSSRNNACLSPCLWWPRPAGLPDLFSNVMNRLLVLAVYHRSEFPQPSSTYWRVLQTCIILGTYMKSWIYIWKKTCNIRLSEFNLLWSLRFYHTVQCLDSLRPKSRPGCWVIAAGDKYNKRTLCLNTHVILIEDWLSFFSSLPLILKGLLKKGFCFSPSTRIRCLTEMVE